MQQRTSRTRRIRAVLGGLCLFAASCAGATDGAGLVEPPTTTVTPRQVAPDETRSTVEPETPTPDAVTAPAPAVIIDALGSIRTVPSAGDGTETAQRTVPGANAVVTTLGCTTSTGCEPADLAAWAENQIDVVNLATAAAGVDGVDILSDHATALLAAGVSSVGYGETLNSALEPTILGSADRPVAIYGISLAPDIPLELIATNATPGIAAGTDAADFLVERVADSLAAGQNTIVMVDWGQIDDRAPTEAELAQLDPFIRVGADAIVGHGSDFLQRFERIERTAIAFNLGNALTRNDEPLRRDTAVFRIQLEDTGDEACLLPATGTEDSVSLDGPETPDCQSS